MAILIIKQYHNLLDGIALPVSHSPITRTGTNASDLREGSHVDTDIQAILDSLSGVILNAFGDLDLDSDATITAVIKYTLGSENNATEYELGAISVHDINNTEITTDTTGVLDSSNSRFGVVRTELSQGAISAHIQHDDTDIQIFTEITIDDGYD